MKETIFVAILLLLAIGFFIAFVVLVSNRDKKKEKEKLSKRLDELMKMEEMTPYMSELMKRRAMAIDTEGNKILLLNQLDEKEEVHCFDPGNLAFCQISKTKHSMNGHIRIVELEFTLKNKTVIRFPFFDDQLDNMNELPQQVKKAEQWKQKVIFYKSSHNAANENEYVA